MTHSDEPDDPTLEANVRELIRRHGSGPAMPPEARERVLAALLASAPPRRRGLATFRARAALAFAAALLLACATMLILWRGAGTPAWAATTRRFERLRGVDAWLRGEERRPGQAPVVRWVHVVRIQPGLTRFEVYPDRLRGGPDSLPTDIYAHYSTPGQSLERHWNHDGHNNGLVREIFEGSLAQRPHPDPSGDLVGAVWERLVRAGRHPARSLGRRTIDGVACQGYDVALFELIRERMVPLTFVHVWVGVADTLPRLLEADVPTGLHATTHMRVERLRWDPPMPSDPTVIPDSSGFRSWSTEEHVYGLGIGRLRPGVSFSLGAPGRTAAITQQDVLRLGPIHTYLRSGQDDGRRPRACFVDVDLTPESRPRLQALLRARFHDTIEIRFDGRLLATPEVRDTLMRNAYLPFDSVRIEPREFERRYVAGR